MTTCVFYGTATKKLESKEISTQQKFVFLDIVWCVHKHSKLPKHKAYAVGASSIITCKGLTENCILPEKEFLDI